MKNILTILVTGTILMMLGTLTYKFAYVEPVKQDLATYLNFEKNIKAFRPHSVNTDKLERKYKASHADQRELSNMLEQDIEEMKIMHDKQQEFKAKTQKLKNVHDKLVRALSLRLSIYQELAELRESGTLTKEKIAEFDKKEQDAKYLSAEYGKEMSDLASKYAETRYIFIEN
ncbi:MAG: hypothetical protein LLG02_15230 [Pelosinus sp.]|nr:hypothetical protein [Pelosinus sp.]